MAILNPVEIWKAIAARVTGDDTVAALLGDGTNGVVYSEGGVNKTPTYPFIRLSVVGLDSNSELSALGKVEMRWQLDIVGPRTSVNWDIADKVAGLLDVPRGNPGGISATGWQIRVNRLNGPVQAVGRTGLKQDGHDVLQLSMDWTLKAESTG